MFYYKSQECMNLIRKVSLIVKIVKCYWLWNFCKSHVSKFESQFFQDEGSMYDLCTKCAKCRIVWKRAKKAPFWENPRHTIYYPSRLKLRKPTKDIIRIRFIHFIISFIIVLHFQFLPLANSEPIITLVSRIILQVRFLYFSTVAVTIVSAINV